MYFLYLHLHLCRICEQDLSIKILEFKLHEELKKDQVSTVLIPETNINANDTKINGVNMKRNIFPVLAF